MLVGDLNDTMFLTDHKGRSFSTSRAAKFTEMVEDCILLEICSSGNSFTWIRRRAKEPLLLKKLDWFFVDPF